MPRDENIIERYLDDPLVAFILRAFPQELPDRTLPGALAAMRKQATTRERQIAEATERGWPIQESK